MKRSFRIISWLLVLTFTISLGAGAFAEGHLPSDVKEGKWYTGLQWNTFLQIK